MLQKTRVIYSSAVAQAQQDQLSICCLQRKDAERHLLRVVARERHGMGEDLYQLHDALPSSNLLE